MARGFLSADAEVERPLYEDPVVFRRRWLLLAMMCLSVVIVIMSVAGLNVALPSIQRELMATGSELQWIIDSYALVFAALLLPCGALGDRFGRKGALLVGLVIFAVGSLVGGLATGPGQIIVGRVITGLGAAFVMPATLSLITAIFPSSEDSRAIAIWAGFAGAGAALGPILSGALLESYWWGSALLVNVPIVAVVLALVWIFAPRSRDPESTPLDPVGAVLSLVGLAALVFGIIEGPAQGWTSPLIVLSFGVAVVGLGSFVLWERFDDHPMLPLDFFRDRRFSVGSGVVTVAFFVMFGWFFLFSLYLQFVRSYSPLDAGLATLPAAVAMVAVAPRTATLAERVGAGPVMAAGFLVIGAGFGLLTFIGTTTPYLVLAIAVVLLGVGISLTAAPATACIMVAVPESRAGVGSAVNDCTREVGGALGIAIMGSIANAIYRSSIKLDDLPLPPPVAEAAKESVGAATFIASQVPGAQVVSARAGEAFTNAFNVACGVAVVMMLAAMVLVAFVFSHRVERVAAEERVAELPHIGGRFFGRPQYRTDWTSW